MKHKVVTWSLVALAALTAGTGAAVAQTFPTKPVRIVVPFAPGGGTDIVARIMGPKLSQALGQPVIIENRPGAGGTTGSEFVAKAAADGYTLGIATSSTHGAAPSLYKKLGYDPLRDFETIALLVTTPFMLAVKKDLPVNSVGDLVTLAKNNPGRLNYASAGVGSSNQLTVELLKMMTGTSLVHVPYKGSGPALADLVSGQVDLVINDLASLMGFVRGGNIKPLAVTSLKRSPMVPDLPTLDESGVRGYEALAWYGILAPRGTPPDVLATLQKAIQGAISDPAIRDQLVRQGFDLRDETGPRFQSFIERDVKKWEEVVKASGASVN